MKKITFMALLAVLLVPIFGHVAHAYPTVLIEEIGNITATVYPDNESYIGSAEYLAFTRLFGGTPSESFYAYANFYDNFGLSDQRLSDQLILIQEAGDIYLNVRFWSDPPPTGLPDTTNFEWWGDFDEAEIINNPYSYLGTYTYTYQYPNDPDPTTTSIDFYVTLSDSGPDADDNTPVPEPATMLLLGFGLAGLAGIRRKFKS